MRTDEIRRQFTAFFVERGHERVPSASLVPNDPTLLFTNAGMNQFKPYFQGDQTPPYDRAVTVQKCMRAGGKHNDLEEVGRTTRHLTFFEMLGNFSFGDYFKEAICGWSWELATQGWGMDPDRLWASVYETDDEAYDIWRDLVGVPAERILRLGKKDNYWSMGVAGPCGPCSELHYDRGPKWGEASPRGPLDNDERYLEFWNLVFMQNLCDGDLKEVGELPKKNIDTGAGLERIAMLLQEKPTVFESDVLMGMIERASEITGEIYGRDERVDFGLRVLADHGRSLTFAIADGVLPSNEDRGYVLRRIMRRAIRHSRLIGFEGDVLAPLAGRCIELMGDAYPEIVARRELIEEIAAREEERFGATLKAGTALLEGALESSKSSSKMLAGDVAFKLHDTFGFPIDLTTEIAGEAGVDVDVEGFNSLMQQQRVRAREARGAGAPGEAPVGVEGLATTEFLGYEQLTCDATVVAILKEGEGVPIVSEGDEAELVLDRTVFYAEGGGQVGDQGEILSGSSRVAVVDTHRLAPGLTGHKVRVTSGEIAVNDQVRCEVNSERRRGSERAHTATHILHWILRDRLGEHATQAGSLVEPGRLRFDFNHFDSVHPDQLEQMSETLKQRVLADDATRSFETSFDHAKSLGAMAMFGEKYGDVVRVVEVGEYSKELCGGTHVDHTSNIGVVVITGEGSVGSNLRRIEALVGKEGIEHLQRRSEQLERAAGLLKSNPDEVADRIERLLATQKEMERRIAEIERSTADSDAETLAAQAADHNGVRVVIARRDVGVDAARQLVQKLKGKLGSSIVLIGTSVDGKANLVAGVTKDLVDKGVTARSLLEPGAALLGGGAGGKPDLAISGGPNADRLDSALDAVRAAALEQLS
jgi:alanyl-tRNA synthetase